MTNQKIVVVKNAVNPKLLSPAQKKFNGLIQKIESQRKRLAEWQETFDRVRQDAEKKLIPLRTTLYEHQTEMVKLLDRQFISYKFTRLQQEKLTYVICELCTELLRTTDASELKAIYNRYSAGDYDAEVQEETEMAGEFIKAMLEHEFGVELDDDEFDANNPQATAERLAEKIKQQQAQTEAEFATRPKRKKSAKQLAKEAREAEEASKVSKSIQSVYRQLTKVLHPDREQDPVERERKNELMQQVTVAYGKRDLLKLLELQLAVEQIDQNTLNNVAVDQLKHYNKVLSEQLREIQDEVLHKEDEIRVLLGIDPFEPLSPKRLGQLLKQDLRLLQESIALLQMDLRQLQDVKQLKAWLKGFRIPEPEFDPFMDDPMFFR